MTEGETTLPDETAIGRVLLRVTDLDEVVRFYERVVGLTVLGHTGEGATLGAGGEPLLELVAAPDAPERERFEAGLFHTALLAPSRQALADALARIERHTTLVGASDHLVSEALYFEDPEGNGIEVYRDRPRSEWPIEGDRIGIDTLPLALDDLREQARRTDSARNGTTVGHVHLEVSSIPRAREHYVGTLGFSVTQSYDSSGLFVAAGGYHHHVGLNVWNGRTDPPTGRGLNWFKVVLPDEAAVSTVRDRLVAADTEVTDTEDGFTVTDPDGITVRLSQG